MGVLFGFRYTYFGEFALSFAAVLGQEACVRLLLRKGADANLQDTNGCTVLHLLVIHDKKVRFDPHPRPIEIYIKNVNC